jgi:cytochrome c biogenesis protein CcmG, thiol:disulfide interchange protein DsbE
MVWRHVGVIGSGHRLGTTACACHAGACKQDKQSDRDDFHHGYLFFRSISPQTIETVTNLAAPIYARKLRRSSRRPREMMAVVYAALSRLWFAQAAALIVAVGMASPFGEARAAPKIDEVAPPLVLTTLDGSTFDLGKLHGKVVMVNYWATWCAPCRKEMPKLDAFYKKYQSQGLEIVGISIDFERDLDKARKVARTVAYPMAVAKAITDDGFGIPKGVPITWIIDTDGKVRDRFIEVRDELLNDIVVPLLPH